MKWFNRASKEEKLQKAFLSEFQNILNTSAADSTLRASFGKLISGGYDFGDILHQIYEDFGYPETLTFSNFWNMYRRFGVARAVCDTPVDITWLDIPEVTGGDAFDKAFQDLVDKVKLWKRIKGADKRQRVGRYAGLFVRIKDNKKPKEPVDTLSGIDNIVSLTPLYEGQLEVATTEQESSSDNFGNPSMYDFKGAASGNRNEESIQSFQIHPSRIIPLAEGADDGSIYGISELESIYNDLMDLRKVSGAGGEGFYQNSRGAPVINTREGYEPPETQIAKDALETQIDEFLNKWRKKFVASGLEFDYPNITLDNPKPFYDNSMSNVSAGSKIPQKLINGTQTGRLAGDADLAYFLTQQMSRRENYATEVIETTIAWFVNVNVLPAPADLTIEWDDLLSQSDADKAEIAAKIATAFNSTAAALSQPSMDGVVDVEDVMTLVFGEEALEEFTFGEPSDGLTDEELADADLLNEDNANE
ncbi:DUF1073 domain-containing protein [Candidatus Pacearchaeota archaeon]|nr:DUF1073 domain-containing protein [Candidatus Pacearchaeota archaeon]